MTEINNSEANIEDTTQKSTTKDSNRLTFVREIIEVLTSSIALIAPAIILILWLFRFGICRFYGLPIFYSSLSIIRFLPVIITGAMIVMYFRFINSIHFSELVTVKINLVSQKKEKKNAYGTGKGKKLFAFFLFYICLLFMGFIFLALIGEIAGMLKGVYPFVFKNDYKFEAELVITCAVIVIILEIALLILVKKERINWKMISAGKKYISKRVKNLIIKALIRGNEAQFMNHYVNSTLSIFLFFDIILLIGFTAITSSCFKRNYYMVNFDDVKYAIVLDTDDYYIGEPIEITELENERKLVIHTDSYIYLDKAENPVVLRRESFDSVTVLRE